VVGLLITAHPQDKADVTVTNRLKAVNGRAPDVRFWHITDINADAEHVRYWE